MRDPDRINRILAVISEIWHYYPDMRLGQILANFADFNTDPYYYEDDITQVKLEAALIKIRKKYGKSLRDKLDADL